MPPAASLVAEQSAHLKRVPDTRERLAAGLGATSARGWWRRPLNRTWFTLREESGSLGGEKNKPASGEGLPLGEAFPESGAAHQASRPAEGPSPSRSASRLLGSSVEDNPGPASKDCIGGWLRPTTRECGPSATSQSHSASREATAARTQQDDFSLSAADCTAALGGQAVQSASISTRKRAA